MSPDNLLGMEPGQLDQIYREVIGPEVFAPYKPATGRPVLILLGGQPGAGKTAAASWLIGQHPDHDIVPIVGDDFRRHHPNYHSILANDPLAMPNITAPAAGRWTHLAAQEALGEGYSLLIEGTWRTSDVPLTTLHQAAEQGYEIHAAVVAVTPLLSRLGTLSRYYDAQARHEPARWTPHEAHDNTVSHLPDSVQTVAGSPEIDRFTILTREATTLLDQKAPRRCHRGQACPDHPLAIAAHSRTSCSHRHRDCPALRAAPTGHRDPARRAADLDSDDGRPGCPGGEPGATSSRTEIWPCPKPASCRAPTRYLVVPAARPRAGRAHRDECSGILTRSIQYQRPVAPPSGT